MTRRRAGAILLAASATAALTLPSLAGRSPTRTHTRRLVMRDGRAIVSSRTAQRVQGELGVSARLPAQPSPTPAEPTPTPIPSSPTPTATTPTPIASQSATATNTYAFVNSQTLSATTLAAYSVVIVKGGLDASELASAKQSVADSNVVNYEQAAALNSRETSEAAALGLLAEDCSGNHIGRLNIPSVTIMDLTNPDAVAWRAEMIAAETNGGYDQTYIDTLGSYFRDKAYTARPCHDGVPITDQQWRDGSIALVQAVRALTGKPVIANGAGLGSGSGYLKHQADSDLLIAAADGVQIEHFARKHVDKDVAFMTTIQARGKSVYAKCDAAVGTCTAAFASAAGPNAYLALL